MNIQNVDIAIAIMERNLAANAIFDLTTWQSTDWDKPAEITEKKVHACGMSACFGGYVAVSPEWKAIGGAVGNSGIPMLPSDTTPKGYIYGGSAIAKWLDISMLLSRELCGLDRDTDALNSISPFYNKQHNEVTIEDVIEKLKLIKSGAIQ